MMNINQSVLASAVINITGNTRGLEQAISQTKKQMQGFMVFANAIGGKTGGLLANALAMGGAGPVLNSVLGGNMGGKASGFLQKMGVMKDPMGDIAAAMDQAKRQFARDTFSHKMAGAGIAVGNMYNGRRLNDAQDVKVARVHHGAARPKMEDYTQGMVAGTASEAQSLTLAFGALGLAVSVAVPVFSKLLSSGMELDRHMKRASRVFGSTLETAMGGYGGAGSNMTQSQFAAGASGIGQELTGAGIGSGRSSRMSSAMTQRAGQIAASWGDDFADVAGDVQSALAGSNTALKKFGVVLSDDLVRAEAFNSGMIKYLEVMSPSVAAQARYNLILAQTNDLARSGGASFFDLNNQWTVFTKNLSSGIADLGSTMTPFVAATVGAANGITKLTAKIWGMISPQAVGNMVLGRIRGPGAQGDPATDKKAMLAQADADAGRAEDVLRRERARQSSNVGFHRPEDFYNTIQKGIFGDPMEFQRRQTDLMHDWVIVSKEQIEAMRDFGYKVRDAIALLSP